MKKGLTIIMWIVIFANAFAFPTAADEFSRPTAYVQSYAVEGSLSAGEDILIRFTIKNASMGTAVNSLLLNVSCPSGALHLSPNTTSQHYVRSIPADGTYDVDVHMNVSDSLVNGVYDVSYTVSYQGSQSDAVFSNSGVLSLVVKGSSLEIVDISLPEQTIEGRLTYFNVKYANTGETELRGVKVQVEGNIEDEGKTTEVGSVRPKNRGIAENNIIFSGLGNQQLAFFLTYEDAGGNEVVSDAYMMATNVVAGTVSSPSGTVLLPAPVEEQDMASQVIDLMRDHAVLVIVVVAILCVLAGITTVNYKKMKRRKS